MLQQILEYWHQLEFFIPHWPINEEKDTNLLKKELPWEYPQLDPNKRITYDVYIGRARVNDLILWMLDSLELSREEDSIEKDNSLVCLCALKIDEHGNYVADSFAISSFVWAVCKIIETSSLNEKLNIAELYMLQRNINEHLLKDDKEEFIRKVSKGYLLKIYKLVCNNINVKDDFLKSTLWSHQNIQCANKKGEFPPLNPSTGLLQSFYLKDIEKIQNSITPKVRNYIEAMLSTNQAKRIQIDTDIIKMQQWLKVDNFPLGVWPSQYSPSLMQQLGINIAISGKQDIFSVNGPPGTGKTTLLKEVVVSNIIQRAIVMVGYDTPEKAFVQENIKNPPDEYNRTYYKPDKKLTAFGMIVASNNNAAVENISLELPKTIEYDRSGCFSSVQTSTNDTYFSDIATQLIDKPAWGLISAKLGNRDNLRKFKDRLWWTEDGVTLNTYYKRKDAPDWNTARENFTTALQAVFDEREEILKAQALLSKQKQVQAHETVIQNQYIEAQTTLANLQNSLIIEQQNLESLENTWIVLRQNITDLHSNISFSKRLFRKLFKNNPTIKKLKQTEHDLEDTIIQIIDQKTNIQKRERLIQTTKTRVEQCEQELHQAQQTLNSINTIITPYKNRFKDNWADNAFWQNISENERSQSACPWTYNEYDKLREELFYQALILHKAFVLSSNCVKQNIMRLMAMWDDKFSKDDCLAAYSDLLNTLLLVVPVVSTTFASVQTFLEYVQAEELGILVIDEAGQATPQSALGAIWRTRKTIIVGDPLQVEPVVTIPKELRKRFADENNIPSIYRLPELSVQMLADQLNPYGGIRNLSDKELWLGCPLIIHRRCIAPMFQISNEVAYNGRMFNQTIQPDSSSKFLLQQSQWFNIKGAENGNKDHSVQKQIEFVANMFEQAIDVYSGLPDLYIITPFTSVARTLRDALRPVAAKRLSQLISSKDISNWLNEHCGTIHTFQGKEVNEVLLVLGCDAQTGKGAAQWVGNKPNIINVAVSRSKYRLAIIGDYALWKDIPYVQTACKYLKP